MHPLNNSLIHTPTHSRPTHSPTHSSTHSLTQSRPTHSLIHSLIHSLTHYNLFSPDRSIPSLSLVMVRLSISTHPLRYSVSVSLSRTISTYLLVYLVCMSTLSPLSQLVRVYWVHCLGLALLVWTGMNCVSVHVCVWVSAQVYVCICEYAHVRTVWMHVYVCTCLCSVVAIDLIFFECPLPKTHAVGEGLVNKL